MRDAEKRYVKVKYRLREMLPPHSSPPKHAGMIQLCFGVQGLAAKLNERKTDHERL